MNPFLLLAVGALLLLLGLAALAFDTVRRRGNPFPQLLSDLTTKLLPRSGPLQAALPRTFPKMPIRAPGRQPKGPGAQANAAAGKLRGKVGTSPRIVPLLFVAAFLVVCLSVGAFVVLNVNSNAQAANGGVIIGLAPFVDAPAEGSPSEAFSSGLLKAAAADGVVNLTVRQSRKTVGTVSEAEDERARMRADALFWGEVAPDGALTVSLEMPTDFSTLAAPWARLRDGDPAGWVYPDQATFHFPAGTGTDPLLPLSLALAHLKWGDYPAAARAGYGASATLDQAGAGGGQFARIVEAGGEFAGGNLSDALKTLDAVEKSGGMPPEAFVDRALVKLAAGDLTGAKGDAERVLGGRDVPDRLLARAYLWHGTATTRRGEITQAISDLEQSARLDPNNLMTKLARAEALYRQSQPDGARAELQALLAKAPAAAPAHRLMGLTLLALGQANDALGSFGQAENLYKGWIAGLRKDEAEAQTVGDTARAQHATDAMLDINKELAGIYLYEGMAWADMARKEPPETFLGGVWRHIRGEPSKLERALGKMQDAQKLDPNRADTALQLADVYTQMGDTTSAVSSLVAAQKLNPAAPEPYLALAKLQQNQHNPREAVATLQQLLTADPSNFEAYRQIYDIYMVAGNTADAQATLRSALNVPAHTASDHLWRGKFLHILGDDGNAVNEARTASLDPQLWEAHLLLGQLLQNAQPPDALAEYQQALAVQPNNADSLLGAGRLLLLAGKADDAQKLFERLTSIWPDNVDGHLAFCQLLVARHDLGKAISEGQKAVQTAPDRADAHFYLAVAHEAQSNWAAAGDEFRAATQRDQNDFEAFIRWAHALMQQDKYAEVIQVSDTAIKLRNNDPQPYRWKAQAQLALGDATGALSSLSNGVQLSPHDPTLLALASRAYTLAGDTAHAATFATSATQADPHSTAGYVATGEMQLAGGHPNDALQAFNSALSIAPQSAEAQVGVGRAYEALGDHSKALEQYAAALKQDGQYAPAHLYAGHTYVAMGRWNEAFNEYRAAVQIRPQWPDALNSLGKAYLERKDLKDAQAAFAKATQGAPQLADAWFGLGIASRDQGQGSDAIKALTQAVNLNANYAQGWLYLGLTYEEAGQRAPASDAFTHARDTAQDASTKEQAEKGLLRVK